MSSFPKITLRNFEPPPWARGKHRQTLLGHLLPSPVLKTKGKRIEHTLPDGDRLVAIYHAHENSKLLVTLFHGLGGSSDADYMQRTARLCLDLGCSVILTNHRGAGIGVGLAKHPYHSGRSDDLSEIIKLARALEPSSKQLSIGFSLSGNALLLLLGRDRKLSSPDFAISVNAPIRLDRCAELLTQGFNRVYDLRFVRLCRKMIADKIKAGLIDPSYRRTYRVSPFSTLRDFDNSYTAPAGGFKDREDYYQTCSTQQYLKNIEIPTLLIMSKDDPFIDYRDYLNAELSPRTHLHLEEHGGHMGYLGQHGNAHSRWLDYALKTAIASIAT